MSELIKRLARPGLWANIQAKRERIKEGSGERMRRPGEEGAPTDEAIRESQRPVRGDFQERKMR